MAILPGVALDGGVCAGKTTVRDALRQRLNLQPIQEFMEVLTAEEARVAFDPESRKTIDLFVEAEVRRRPPKIDAAVCLDRSFLTLAAYRYAAYQMGLLDRDEVEYSGRRILEVSWLCPSAFIFLDVPEDLRRERSAKRDVGKNMPFPLLDPEFNDLFTRFFREMAINGHVSLVSNDSRQRGLDEVLKEIEAAIRSTLPKVDGRLAKVAVELMLS